VWRSGSGGAGPRTAARAVVGFVVMGKRKKKKWGELSSAQRSAIVVGGALELVVTVVTLRDLARRPSSGVRGPKPLWVMACGVQPVGPLAYWAVGRRTD
jgi:hypothetical protein